jgi:dihydroorotate dehydrogenase
VCAGSVQGASLLEVYTSFAYGGPHQIHVIKKELSQLLYRDGYSTVAEAVGIDHRKQRQTTPKPEGK